MFEKVLSVEDEKSIQLIIEVALKRIGKKDLRIVNNGQEALDELKEWKPDVILMDVLMPVKTGPETLKILKADDDLKDIPVIFMTAKSEDEEISYYKSLGALEIICKPFNPMNLMETIEMILKKA